MKARGSGDPKVEEDHDPEEEASHDEIEDQVEKDLAIVATLQEDQEEEVYDSQSEMGVAFRSEGAEQPPNDPNHPTDTRPVARGRLRLISSNQQIRKWQSLQQRYQRDVQDIENEVERTRTEMEEKHGKGFWEQDKKGNWVQDFQGSGDTNRIRETARYLGLLRLERKLMEAREILEIQQERDIALQVLTGDT